MTTSRIPYTGPTTALDTRFPPASITGELSQFRPDAAPFDVQPIPDDAPYAVAVLFCVAVALILGACWLVLRVNDHVFAVLAAGLVAGFIWLAFGKGGSDDRSS